MMKPWIILAIIMGADTYLDIRQREIFPILTLTGAAAGAAQMLFLNGGMPLELLFALIPGAVLMAGSVLSKGQIGFGDALVMFTLGTWTDLWTVWEILLCAIFMASIFAVILWTLRRRNDEIPFVPFLSAALAALWIIKA